MYDILYTYGIGSLLDSIWNEVVVCCIDVDWDMEDPGLDWKSKKKIILI